ncbi:MAG TPA: hypothetical protein VMX55_15465 [candidate division Zixibacteria bacterium]|nr:hypothetical protein [candidate division Zixibacteria bacterium]
MSSTLNKKWLKCVILLSISLMSLPILSTTALNALEYNESVFEISFISAEYLDADLDGFEDDTRFFVDVDFNPSYFDGTLLRMDADFEIILPSGTTFAFIGFIRLESRDCIIQFDVYNTVTEPGWYTINFNAYVKIRMTKYHSFDTIIFDPPTGTGEGGGSPTIGL